jgi:acetyl esterase/lipase
MAPALTWRSAAIDAEVTGELFLPPAPADRPIPTVVYLKNLSIPRLGRDDDASIIRDLLADGCMVLVVDYRRHAKATSPQLNADVLKLRRDIAGKQRALLADRPVDVNRLFILPEGFRLRRDVEFARDGDRVLEMDVLYPASPVEPAPLLLEVTCDNRDRMGAFSLLYCEDTLVEGATLAGFAAAMVDHPVAPPYKGIDSMPADFMKLESAVRKARELAGELGLNGRIGAMGFSRGGPSVAMLAARGRGDSSIQAALVHGNRYDYLNLLPDDPMRRRFEAAWGPAEQNREHWANQSVVTFVGPRTAPMFLNTSAAESPEYRHGLEQLHRALAAALVEHVYLVDRDVRGHKVATDFKTLDQIYTFFRHHLGK